MNNQQIKVEVANLPSNVINAYQNDPQVNIVEVGADPNTGKTVLMFYGATVVYQDSQIITLLYP